MAGRNCEKGFLKFPIKNPFHGWDATSTTTMTTVTTTTNRSLTAESSDESAHSEVTIDPICGMRVPNATLFSGNVVFCGQRCKQRYDNGVIDPICGMTVDPGKAREKNLFSAAVEGGKQFFCGAKCKQRFEDGVTDPICGMSVNPTKAREKNLVGAPVGEDRGKQFFCGAKCKQRYESGEKPTKSIPSCCSHARKPAAATNTPPPDNEKLRAVFVYECPMQCIEGYVSTGPGACPDW